MSLSLVLCFILLGVLPAGPVLGVNVLVAQAYLAPPTDSVQESFGSDLAIDGDIAVVGSHADSGGSPFGGAFVFVRDGSTWGHATALQITLPPGTDPPSFGGSVAVSGDTIVVGAHGEDVPDPNDGAVSLNRAGAVYVFTRNGTSWSQQQRLTAPNIDADDKFGSSVAIDGDTLVVASVTEDGSSSGVNGNQADNAASNSGAVYVFQRSGDTWSPTAYLKPSNTGADDLFGTSLSIDGDTLVIGARGEDSAATGANGSASDESASEAGAAYVFTRTSGSWSQQAYLKPSNTRPGFAFGCAVAVDGDSIVVGAPGEDSSSSGVGGNQADSSADDAGAAYVFTRTGSAWAQQAYVKASNTGLDDEFGSAVALQGNRLGIAAPNEGSAAVGINGDQSNNSMPNAGAAYVYTRTNGLWTQNSYVKAIEPNGGDGFGAALAAAGGSLIVGAPNDEVGELTNRGGVHVFQWVNDTLPPVTGNTVLSIREGGRIASAPMRISWSAIDDTSAAGQLRHTVEMRHRTSVGWTQWKRLASGQSATWLDVSIALKKEYQARVRTSDQAGNVSSWAVSPTLWAATRQESKFTLKGNWSAAYDPRAMGDRVVKSRKVGSNARFVFTGRGIGVVTPTGSLLGVARVCVDKGTASAACRDIDLGALPSGVRRVAAVFGGLPLGQHTLDVTVKQGLVILDGAIIWR